MTKGKRKRTKQRERKKPGPKPVYPPGVAESLGIVQVGRMESMAQILDTAIWLWVLEKDPLSIHLLTMSQFHCLQDLGKAPFAATCTDMSQLDLLYDSLRHSSDKTSIGIDYKPSANDGLLYDVICSFDDLFGQTTIYMKAFLAYYAVRHSQNDSSYLNLANRELPKGVATTEFNQPSKTAFFTRLAKSFRKNPV